MSWSVLSVRCNKKTSRGGAVIGNSFKTIFTRLQSIEKLETMQKLGVEVTNTSGDILGATQLMKNLAGAIQSLPETKQLQIAEDLVGRFQVSPFVSILEDYNDKTSIAIKLTEISQNAATAAYDRNAALNETMSAAINKSVVSLRQLATTLGEIGVTENLTGILDFFNNLVENVQGLFDEKTGSDMAKNVVKGLGSVLSGPGLAMFGAVIAKLFLGLTKFGLGSMKTFFGLNKYAQEQAQLQGQIASTLLGSEEIQKHILTIERSGLSVGEKRKQQAEFFSTALNEQLGTMRLMQGIARKISPGVMAGTNRMSGKGAFGRGAGGYVPNFNAVLGYGSEQADINKGVGGAPRSARPVSIPNFNFGGGQKGTMVANDSEYVVPNFAGGSAIFNQNMIASMGLPSGAKKVGAAGGYIPNFNVSKVGQTKGLTLDEAIAKGIKRPALTTGFTKEVVDKKLGAVSKDGKPVAKKTPASQIFDADARGYALLMLRQGEGGGGARKYTHTFNKEPYLGFKKVEGTAYPVQSDAKLLGSYGKMTKLESLLDDSLAAAANRVVQSVAPINVNPSTVNASNIDELIKDEGGAGALEAVKGALFESITNAVLEGQSGTDKKGKLDIQFVKRNKAPLSTIFGLPQGHGYKFADYKASINSKDKFVRQAITHSTRKSAAGGFIPNFAGDLENAIGREAAAGVPINQIRVNQKGSLRNSSNPQGLAVTNTRDEPTGAIPNFQSGGSNLTLKSIGTRSTKVAASLGELNQKIDSLNKEVQEGSKSFDQATREIGEFTQKLSSNSGTQTKLKDATKGAIKQKTKETKARRDLLGPIFAVQAGLSFLSGATDDAGSAMGKYTNIVSDSLSGATSAVFAATAVKDFGDNIAEASDGLKGKFGAALGKLSIFAGAIGVGIALFKGLNEIMNQRSGLNDRVATSMARLADISDELGRQFKFLNEVQKLGIKRKAESVVGGQVYSDKEIQKALGFSYSISDLSVSPGTGRGFDERAAVRAAEARSKLEKAGFDPKLVGASRRFEGGGKAGEELEAGFNEVARSMIAMGKTTEEVDKILDVFEGTLDEEELNKFADAAKNLTDEFNEAEKAFEKYIKTLDVGLVGPIDPSKDPNLSQKDKDDIAKLTPEARQRIRGIVEQEKLDKDAADRAARKAKIEKIGLETAKLRIKSAADLKKIELANLSTLKSRIDVAGILGNLSKEELRNLRNQQIQEETTNKLTDIRLNSLSSVHEQMVGIIADNNKVEDVIRDIMALTHKDLKEKKNIETILKKQLNITGNLEASQQIVVDQIFEKIKAESTSVELGQKKVQATRDEADAAHDLADALDRAFKDRTHAAGRKAFETTLGVEEKIRGKQRDVTRLGQRLAGGPMEAARIESQMRTLTVEISQLKRGQTEAQLLKEAKSVELELGRRDLLGMGLGARKTAEENLAAATTPEKAIEVLKVFKGLGMLTKDQAAKLQKNIESLEDNTEKRRKDTESSVKNAELAAKAATALEKAVHGFTVVADQAGRMGGLDSEVRAARRRGAAVADRPDLTPANAQRLSDMQRGVFERLMETPALTDSLVQADTLAQTLTDAALTFKDNISSALVDAIAKGQSLGDTLRQAASDFFYKMSQALMNNAINKMFGSAMGGGGGGGFFKNLLGLNSGGPVKGGSGGRDDVPALLTGGEFVMNKRAVKNYGSGFMGALNSGAVPKFANGGLFTPGTYGQGAIKGSSNLLSFATQSYTGGLQDMFLSGRGLAGLALEPQSGRLTMAGRRNSPAFQKEQASKRKAFDLFSQQYSQNQEERKRKEESKGALMGSILSFGVSALASNLLGGGLSSLFSKGKATGGAVPYSAGIDSVPTMLSGGEFVMNAGATQTLGAGNLAALNAGGGIGGGGGGAIVGKLDELNETIASSNTEINITVNSDGTENTNETNAPDQQRGLAVKIKDVVRQVIEDEKRLGGSLRMA
jgi:hypothetical protein